MNEDDLCHEFTDHCQGHWAKTTFCYNSILNNQPHSYNFQSSIFNQDQEIGAQGDIIPVSHSTLPVFGFAAYC